MKNYVTLDSDLKTEVVVERKNRNFVKLVVTTFVTRDMVLLVVPAINRK